MRILLVNPPRSPENAIYAHAPAEARPYIHRKLIGPPLGLLTLATAARRRGHEVHLLELKAEYDLRPDADPPEVLLRRWLRRLRPGLVGTTVIASELPAGLDLLRAAKAHDPGITTIAGGLHAILRPADLDDPAVDLVSAVQSPYALARVADVLQQGRGPTDPALEGIGGLWRRGPGGLSPTAAPPPREDPAGADYVPPDRALVRPWLGAYVVGKAPGPSTYLFSSLGCPHRCTFCSIWPQFGGRFYQRAARRVVQEMASLDEYAAVRFADAHTLANPGFGHELCDQLEAEGVRKIMIMDLRVDTAVRHPRLVERLARAGLKVAIVGFESFRADELRRYNKAGRVEQIGEAARVLHENGVLVRGNYVIPPDYTRRDFTELARFAARYPVALSGYTILTPMPGTAFYDEVKDQVVDPDLTRYNFFNCVTRPALGMEAFYRRVAGLWRIRLGDEVI